MKPPKKTGRPSTGKITVQLRMAESTKAELEHLALQEHRTLSEYAENVLLRHFRARRKNGIE